MGNQESVHDDSDPTFDTTLSSSDQLPGWTREANPDSKCVDAEEWNAVRLF